MRRRLHHFWLDNHLRLRLRRRLRLRLRWRRLLERTASRDRGNDEQRAQTQTAPSRDTVPITETSANKRHGSMLSGNFVRHPVGGGGRESNPPATILAAKPVLKTGGATGPLPPPPLFIRYLQRFAQSEGRLSAHLLPTISDFGFDGWFSVKN